ncbi:MAG: hypothetical protein QG675_684 [Patescibacteria group bacterium]|nr:hypothetical protein [Patescibacteria group bacterium]
MTSIECLGGARNSEEFLAEVVGVSRLLLGRHQALDVGLAAGLGALVLTVDRVARTGAPAVAGATADAVARVPTALLGLGRAVGHGPRTAGVQARGQLGRRDEGPVDVGHVVARGPGRQGLESVVGPGVLAGEQVAEALTDHVPS